MDHEELTDQDFAQFVEDARLPVLVDFWAEWCVPCRQLNPILEDLADEFLGKVLFRKLNVDENPETTSRLGIRALPTLAIYSGGAVVDTQLGLRSKTALRKWIESSL
ncbi:MAG: thioredoxin [Rhodobacteraceae bacterium]|nr:thioredoxin [Paracoccaceae bacterium]